MTDINGNQTEPSTIGSTAQPRWSKGAVQSIRGLFLCSRRHSDDPYHRSGRIKGIFRRLRNRWWREEQARLKARMAMEIDKKREQEEYQTGGR